MTNEGSSSGEEIIYLLLYMGLLMGSVIFHGFWNGVWDERGRYKNLYRVIILIHVLIMATSWLWIPWIHLGITTAHRWNMNLVNNREGKVIIEKADDTHIKAPMLENEKENKK